MAGNKGQCLISVYSNDGTENFTPFLYVGEAPAVLTFAIVNDGLVCEYYDPYNNSFYSSKEYTYLGKKIFKGFATSANAIEPTYAIGDTFSHSAKNDTYATVKLYIVEEERHTTFDLSTLNLSAGMHRVTVKARASGYADSAPSDAVSYVVEGANTVQVSGTWIFNEFDVDFNSNMNQQVSFISNGETYTGIWFNKARYGVYYLQGNAEILACDFVPSGTNGWKNEAYRTITFDGVQTVSKEFYEWLMENTMIYPATIQYNEDTCELTITDDDRNGDRVVSYNLYIAENDVYVGNVLKIDKETIVKTSDISNGSDDWLARSVDIYGYMSAPSNKKAVCFVAGTPILMANNKYKMIEEIIVGDEVKSYYFKNATYCQGTVTKVATGYATRIAMIWFEDGHYIAMSEGHPLYTKDGWRSLTNHNGYPTLVVGDKVLGRSGYVAIQDIQVVDTEPTMVYSLGVVVSNGEEIFDGTYFAGMNMTMATHSGGSN